MNTVVPADIFPTILLFVKNNSFEYNGASLSCESKNTGKSNPLFGFVASHHIRHVFSKFIDPDIIWSSEMKSEQFV